MSALSQAQGQSAASPLPPKVTSFDSVLRVTNVVVKQQTNAPHQLTPVDVEVLRFSDKVITAYGLQISLRYADASESKTEVADDLIRTLVPGFAPDPGLTQYGQSHRATFLVPSDQFGAPPVLVSAAVVWAAFDDKTVSGNGHTGSLDVIVRNRENESRYLGDLLRELQDAQNRPDISAAFAAGQAGSGVPLLQQAIADLKLNPPAGPQDGPHQRRSSDLGSFAGALRAGKPAFDSLIDGYTNLRTVFAEHSKLMEAK
jgi:hypothetical protein